MLHYLIMYGEWTLCCPWLGRFPNWECLPKATIDPHKLFAQRSQSIHCEQLVYIVQLFAGWVPGEEAIPWMCQPSCKVTKRQFNLLDQIDTQFKDIREIIEIVNICMTTCFSYNKHMDWTLDVAFQYYCESLLYM